MTPWSMAERSDSDRENVPGTTALATSRPAPTPVSGETAPRSPCCVIGRPAADRDRTGRSSGAQDPVLLLLELGARQDAGVPEFRQVLELGQLGIHVDRRSRRLGRRGVLGRGRLLLLGRRPVVGPTAR